MSQQNNRTSWPAIACLLQIGIQHQIALLQFDFLCLNETAPRQHKNYY